jgi:hypothetical protein
MILPDLLTDRSFPRHFDQLPAEKTAEFGPELPEFTDFIVATGFQGRIGQTP